MAPIGGGSTKSVLSDRWIVYTKSRKQFLHRKDLLYDTGSITRKQMLCLDLRIKNPTPNPNLFITFRNLVYILLSLWAHVRGEWATKKTWRNVVDISSLLNYLKHMSLGKPQKKKVLATKNRATKRGGGVKAGPLRKKELFLKLFFYFVAI